MDDSAVPQPADDPSLLDLMMEDLRAADPQFQPTNYWAVYEQRFLPQLKKHGLRDFRRQKDLVFRSFGAVDFDHPFAELVFRKSPAWRRFPLRHVPGVAALAARLDRALGSHLWLIDGMDMETYVRLGYSFAKDYASVGRARPLSAFSMSMVGNPPGVVRIEGNLYTRQMIQYYLQYAYVSRYVDLEQMRVVAELGSGMGRQTEILYKLHPQAAYLLFDIPPQIYVAEQYLKAVFPGRVVSYRETRSWNDLDTVAGGFIYIFGNHKMPLLRGTATDLFWNSASFHEMEPDVVREYLRFVNASAKWAYLSQNLKGGGMANRPGQPGILRATSLEDYRSGLPDFDLVEMQPTLRINGKPLLDHGMIFRRRERAGET